MYRPGIFNETFDTVLFKPELRAAQLYRFACELTYCIIHDGEIRLSEPQGTDQFFIIRLLQESLQHGSELDLIARHLQIVQKPRFNRERGCLDGVEPLPRSLALNLLNPIYDFSCLDDTLEKTVRRPEIKALGAVTPDKCIQQAQALLRVLDEKAGADDRMAIAYWERLLAESHQHDLADGERLCTTWNGRRERDSAHALPWLAPTNLSPHPRFKETTMGQAVEKMCSDSERRKELWRTCKEVLREMFEAVAGSATTDDARKELRKKYTPAVYFNARSNFYTSRDIWAQRLLPGDYLFLKELLDSVYGEVVANTCQAGNRVFMPGDLSSEDQAEAQRLVADNCRPQESQQVLRMAYQSDPVAWGWEDFLRVMKGMNEALRDAEFITARAEFIGKEDLRAHWEALKRLQDPLNRSFRPAGVELLVNDDASFTVATVRIMSSAGDVRVQTTDNRESRCQGEHQCQ